MGPQGHLQHPDMCYGKPDERPGADTRIAQVPMPASDPAFGLDGLVRLWTAGGAGQRYRHGGGQ